MTTSVTISRVYTFSAAHRIEGHPKCGRIHGHNYEVTVEVTGPVNSHDGMVIDYGKLDELVKPLIDRMDHRYISSSDNLEHNDPYAALAAERGECVALPVGHTTAEELSKYLAYECMTLLIKFGPVDSVTIIVKETPKSVARFTYA